LRLVSLVLFFKAVQGCLVFIYYLPAGDSWWGPLPP